MSLATTRHLLFSLLSPPSWSVDQPIELLLLPGEIGDAGPILRFIKDQGLVQGRNWGRERSLKKERRRRLTENAKMNLVMQ